MSNTTVEQFATEMNKPVDVLLKQLQSAGVNKSSGSDSLTLEDKQLLAQYLKSKMAATTPPSASPAPKKKSAPLAVLR